MFLYIYLLAMSTIKIFPSPNLWLADLRDSGWAARLCDGVEQCEVCHQTLAVGEPRKLKLEPLLFEKLAKWKNGTFLFFKLVSNLKLERRDTFFLTDFDTMMY